MAEPAAMPGVMPTDATGRDDVIVYNVAMDVDTPFEILKPAPSAGGTLSSIEHRFGPKLLYCTLLIRKKLPAPTARSILNPYWHGCPPLPGVDAVAVGEGVGGGEGLGQTILRMP